MRVIHLKSGDLDAMRQPLVPNRILCVTSSPLGKPSPIERWSPALWSAIKAEFERNGGRTLTDGKVRQLRRQLTRSQSR